MTTETPGENEDMSALDRCSSCGMLVYVIVGNECPACGGAVTVEEDDGSVEGYRLQDVMSDGLD
jgi:ABC-type ATPase with predicted acetyltransferase domain